MWLMVLQFMIVLFMFGKQRLVWQHTWRAQPLFDKHMVKIAQSFPPDFSGAVNVPGFLYLETKHL